MDWYWKAALIVSLVWGAGRALGVYGQAERDLDISFLFDYLLTLGGWGAVFYVIDRVAKFLGWKRTPDAAAVPGPVPASPPGPVASTPSSAGESPKAPTRPAPRRSSRRPRP